MFEPKDILLFENGSGGEISVSGGDIQLSQQLMQQVYLALFGGNTEAETTGQESSGEIRADYWANSLFFAQERRRQFNSQTEHVLNNTPLNSSGRIAIRQAVEVDLQYLNGMASVSVDVIIKSTNIVSILVYLTKPDSSANEVLFTWDKAKEDLTIEYKI